MNDLLPKFEKILDIVYPMFLIYHCFVCMHEHRSISVILVVLT